MVRNSVISIMTFAICLIAMLPIAVGATGQENPQVLAENASELVKVRDFRGAERELRRAIQLAPGQSAYLSALASTFAMEGNLSSAALYFEKALSVDSTNVRIRRDLAATQWQLGQLRAAKANLRQVLRSDPRDRQAILLLGMVAENSKDYATAARMLGSIPSELSQHPEARAALVHAYYESGQRAQARQAIDASLNEDKDPQALFLMAQVATQEKDFEIGERVLTSIKSTYPDQRALQFELASLQYRSQRFADCQETLVDLIKAGDETSDVYNLLGWAYESQGRTNEATRALDRAVQLNGKKEANYLDLIQILLNQHQFTRAQEVARKLTELFPSSFRAYDLRGTAETRASDFGAAAMCYSRAVELEPHNAQENLLLAQAQERAGMKQEAERTLRRGMRLFPRDGSHFQEFALMLLKDVQPEDSATKVSAAGLLQTAVRLDPQLWESHHQLGELWIQEKQNAKGLKELEIAERLRPGSSKVHYSLWRAYRRQGREQEAAKERALFESATAEEEASLHRPPEPAKRTEQR